MAINSGLWSALVTRVDYIYIYRMHVCLYSYDCRHAIHVFVLFEYLPNTIKSDKLKTGYYKPISFVFSYEVFKEITRIIHTEIRFHKCPSILTGTNMHVNASAGNKSETPSCVQTTVAKLRDNIYKLLILLTAR